MPSKEHIETLLSQMETPEYDVLHDSGKEYLKREEIALSDDTKARFSAMLQIGSTDLTERVASGSEYAEYYISDTKLREDSKKLFGKELSSSDISSKAANGTFDVYNTLDGAVLRLSELEDEGDYDARNVDVQKNGSIITATKDVYCGYWGANDGKTANYRVIYTLKEDPASSFGYVIKSMAVEPVNTEDQHNKTNLVMTYDEVEKERERIKSIIDSGTANKVVIPAGKDASSRKKELYYENGKLIFSFCPKGVNGEAEERFYFKDGQMIRWIVGTSPNQTYYNISDETLPDMWNDKEKEYQRYLQMN